MSVTTFLSLSLLGIAGGAFYGMLGTSVTVFYRASGVINFALGAVATYTAFVYYELATNGQLALPWVKVGFIPSSITVSHGGVSVWLAGSVALAMAALLGGVTYLLVFRPLRNASGLAKLIASVGLMLYFQATVALNFGSDTVRPPTLLPSGVLRNFLGLGGAMPVSALWTVAIALIVAACFSGFYRYTRVGKAVRAVAENEKGAVLLGYSRVWLGVLSSVMAAVVAGLAGILVSPVTSLDSINLTLFIVPALAAALVGGLVSPIVTTLGGIAIGFVQTAASVAVGFSWFPVWLRSGAGDVVPFLVIVLVLFLRADRIPDRATITTGVLPESPVPRHPIRSALLGGGVLIVLLFVLNGSWLFALDTSVVTAVLLLSFVVIVGQVGQISVAQLALAGVSAYGLCRFGVAPPGSGQHSLGLPFLAAALLAVVLATTVGVAMGLPALRLRGQQLVVVTIAGAIAITSLFLENPSLTGIPLGGAAEVPRANIGPLNLSVRNFRTGLSDRWQFGAFAIVVLLVVSIVVARLRAGRTGRQFLALRSNERAAAASGINVARTKLLAFGLSSAIAGCAGVLLATQQTAIQPGQFDVFTAIGLLALVTIGGIAAVSGAYFGAIITVGGLLSYFMSVHVAGLNKYIPLLGAVAVLVQIVQAPSGIVVKSRNDLVRLGARISRRHTFNEGGTRPPEAEQAPIRVMTSPEPAPLLEPPEPEPVAGIGGHLHVRNLSVHYGGVVACDEIEFRVESGQMVGLVGPNGAGKTTLIDAVTGFAPTTGAVQVELDDYPLDRLSPNERYRRGLARTFQSAELFEDLTLFENLLITAEPQRWTDPIRDLIAGPSSEAVTGARTALEMVGLSNMADARAGQLSTGERKLAGVARALAARPKVLLLDEPAAGLDTTESQKLGQQLKRIQASGVSIVLVDHDMSLVFDVCDPIYVLAFGRVIASGTPSEVRADEAVIEAYLGQPADTDADADDVPSRSSSA